MSSSTIGSAWCRTIRYRFGGINSMKAALYTKPNTIEVRNDVTDPDFLEGVMVRVKTTGFCATDVKMIKGLKKSFRPLPLIFGHEFAGEVVKSTVTKYVEGDRVAIAPFAGCGVCRFCLRGDEHLCRNRMLFSNGSTAEYTVVGPELAVKAGWKLPVDVTWEEGALTEPLACVVLSLRACDFRPGDSVLVLGGGVMGLLHVLLAKAWGARRVMVSEPGRFRREFAATLGADVVDPTNCPDVGSWARDLSGEGPDIIVVAAGSAEVGNAALQVAGRGSRIQFFGGMPSGTTVAVDTGLIHYSGVTLLGTSGFRSVDVQSAADMIRDHAVDLKQLVTHRFPVEEAQTAFETTQKEEALRVMVENTGW